MASLQLLQSSLNCEIVSKNYNKEKTSKHQKEFTIGSEIFYSSIAY